MARWELKHLPKGIKIKAEHIFGHQDKMVNYNDLPKIAQMNVDCNEGAKTKAQEPQHNRITNIQGRYCGSII